MTTEQKQERAKLKAEAKELAIIQAEKNQKPVESMKITIEWKKSKMWGSNPHADVFVRFKDGESVHQSGFTCSGCGYDKESTVVGQIFDQFMKYELWKHSREQVDNAHVYGIHAYNDESRCFGKGIGISCYYQIAQFLGGKFTNIASGKTFDVYEYRFLGNNI